MERDPKQYTNLFDDSEYSQVLSGLKADLQEKLAEISDNDLDNR